MALRTPVGTCHYPSVFQPRDFDGGEARYEVTLSFNKDTDLSTLREAADVAASEKWPKKRPDNYRSPFLEGDPDDPHLAGRTIIRLKSRNKPQVVDSRLEPIDSEDLDGIYPGCQMRCSVAAFAYDISGNRGVSFLLNNCQKIGDGERIGGRTTAEEDFDVVADEPSDAASDLI